MQHLFSRSKEKADQISLRRQQAYGDYLQGVAKAAHRRSDGKNESAILVADAKARMTVYGSVALLAQLANFERSGANLADEKCKTAFIALVGQMRRETSDVKGEISREDLSKILFGE